MKNKGRWAAQLLRAHARICQGGTPDVIDVDDPAGVAACVGVMVATIALDPATWPDMRGMAKEARPRFLVKWALEGVAALFDEEHARETGRGFGVPQVPDPFWRPRGRGVFARPRYTEAFPAHLAVGDA
jgi:hypothetical protein